MKKILLPLLFSFTLGIGTMAYGQSGNGNGNNGNAVGQQHSAIPTQTVVKILKIAGPDFASRLGVYLSLGQWMQKFQSCECTIIEIVKGVFRVEFGGGGSIVVLEDF